MEIILTPTKRLSIGVLLFIFFILIAYIFIRGLTENSIDKLKLKQDSQNVNTSSHSDNVLENEGNHVHIFVQISDLHLSVNHDKQRGPDFKDFCNNTIPTINPECVLVTGDITDAKYPDKQGSIQFEEEWKQYHKILADTKVLLKSVWLDTRGNHDAFDVPSLESDLNYFKRYSVQGRKHDKSYHHVHRSTNGDTFSFIGFDACPDPGPRRPFNFFGIVTEDDLAVLEQLKAESRSSNMTIWFGHYPTSVITGDINRLRNILGKGSVYMSGHLHTLGGLLPDMYARQQAGYLELEVGDWMDNRIYRVFAVDHGLFSFTDEKHNTWPVVLITNPKHAQFIMPDKEPLSSILHSTHIRILVFSPSSIVQVSVSVDGKYLGDAVNSGTSLYTLPWNPQQYHSHLHSISVKVQDAGDRERVVSQPFTMDNTQIYYNFWRRFLLMSQHTIQGKTVFVLMFVLTVFPMLLSKVINFSINGVCPCNGVGAGGDSCCSCLWVYQLILRRYKLIANTPTVYWPLLAFHFYVALGPWFIGEVLKGHVGAMFVYGLYVHGTFIPGSLTYMYGFFQLVMFNIPLMYYLAYLLDHRICAHKHPAGANKLFWTTLSRILHHTVFALILVFQLYLVYFGTYRAYGLMAIVLCPVRTWSVVFALVMRWVARGKKLTTSKPTKQVDFRGL